MPREIGQTGQGRATTFRESDLKICELCGWLNLESNDECFVCGWHGRFERDPRMVHSAIGLALRENGPLELHDLTEVASSHAPVSNGLIGKCFHWLRTLYGRNRSR